MSNKRYYWLKLKDNFFNEKAIKKLRKIAGGDTYTIIYLKLLLKSMKTGGKLYFDGIEDNFCEELALDIDEDDENVKVTFMYLQRVGLLKEINEREIELTEMHGMVGSETSSAARVRKHRQIKNEQQKALQCNTPALQCNSDVTKCNTEIEIELDKEIELDNRTIDINNTKEIKKEINKERKKERKEPEKQRKENVISFNQLIENYTENQQLRDELKEHLKVRKNKKAALTNRAIELSLKKLDDLAANDAEKIQMVQNAIMSGWTTFYPLKADEKQKMGGNASYDMRRYEKSANVFEPPDESSMSLSEFMKNPKSKSRKDLIDVEVLND